MKTIDILVASPYPVMLDGVRQFIRMENDIRIVADASTAQDMLDRCRGSAPDVCLVDFDITNGEGHRLIDALRATCWVTSVLALTGACEHAQISIVGLRGAIACVAKSASGREIIAAIRATARVARQRAQAG